MIFGRGIPKRRCTISSTTQLRQLIAAAPHIEMESSVAMWEAHLTQIMVSTIRTRFDEQREKKATRRPRHCRRQDAKNSWEITKNSAFFGKARFPHSVILRIDAQIDLRCRPGSAQTQHTLPAVASVQEWKLDDYADCVVEVLMTLHLGADLAAFRAREVSECPGMNPSRLKICFWRCLGLRDIVAHANAILTIVRYPREWKTAPQASSANTFELCNLMVAGEKRKALVLDTDLTSQQVAARKLPRVSVAVEQKTADKSEAHGISTPVNSIPATITTSTVTKQSIIREVELKSASLVSSIGPQPAIQDLEDRLKPLDVDITAEDWVSQLAVQYACNKMEARLHQLLKDHHSEKIRVIKEFEQSIIDGITHMAETPLDHDQVTELAGL